MRQDRKLEAQHKEFLLSEQTLRHWAGLTIRDRVILFHRKFPNKKISESGLRRLYMSNGVRQKQIKAEKRLSNRTISTFEFQKQEILRKMRDAK